MLRHYQRAWLPVTCWPASQSRPTSYRRWCPMPRSRACLPSPACGRLPGPDRLRAARLIDVGVHGPGSDHRAACSDL